MIIPIHIILYLKIKERDEWFANLKSEKFK